MIAEGLARALIAFDEQALATLANPGLVRRAQRDLDSGKVVLEACTGEIARLAVDGQHVEIGPAGPAAATCDCPAVGICRHRIGAVLLLRTLQADRGHSVPAAADDASFDPQEIVAAISLEDLRKFAGLPGWRAAAELLEEATAVQINASSIAVSFGGLDEPVLILRGQGVSGIVSKASKARKKPYHAAAVLAARRHFGLPPDGLHDEDASAAPPAPAAPDPDYLDRIGRALVDCARLGFNLAPVPLEESLFELSVSSRADSLPRLASILRAISAQMRLRRQRSFAFEAGQMLELVATAHALCRAMVRVEPADPRLSVLAGETRRSYQPLGDIQLLGCGAELWRTQGGARGATVHFLDEAAGRFYTVSHARGAGQDPLFDPQAAFRDMPVWQAGTLERLAHARIVLSGASAAEDGRLSAGKDVRARILEPGVPPVIASPHVHLDWLALHEALLGQFGLGVEATTTTQMVLLTPANSARPSFDELAQRLVWPVRDAQGRWLALMLDHDERSGQAIERLEEQLGRGWRGTVLARVSPDDEGLSLFPVSLIGATEAVDLTIAPRGYSPMKGRDRLAWLRRLRPSPGQSLRFVQPAGSQRAIGEAWQHVLDRLEAGPQLARLLDDKRAAHASRLTDYGMARLGELVGAVDEGETLLAAAYALLVARRQRLALPLLA